MRPLALLPTLAALATLAASAGAQTVLYDDTTAASTQSFTNGGAATDPANAANTITNLVADDIALGAGFGGATITGVSLLVANAGSAPTSARVLVRLYTVDPGTGGPATLLRGFSVAAAPYASGATLVTIPLAAGSAFVAPANGRFWAGVTFDDASSTTGASVAGLNNLGQRLANPPSVGSSSGAAFETNANGSFLASNPAGGAFTFTDGTPANFGWRFVGNAPVPEPASIAALGLGALAVLKRRRRSA